jgi:hypothetical protein
MCDLPHSGGAGCSLGAAGRAVIVARNVRDLRRFALPWALDPQVDVDGSAARPRSRRRVRKILAYEKRLEELDDQQILANLTGVSFERRGEVVVVDVIGPDGTWDQRKSVTMETKLAAIDRFSMLPGAPAQPQPSERPAKASRPAGDGAAAKAAAAPPAKPEPKGPPLSAKELDGKVVLVFPAERFDLDVAAALGKRD